MQFTSWYHHQSHDSIDVRVLDDPLNIFLIRDLDHFSINSLIIINYLWLLSPFNTFLYCVNDWFILLQDWFIIFLVSPTEYFCHKSFFLKPVLIFSNTCFNFLSKFLDLIFLVYIHFYVVFLFSYKRYSMSDILFFFDIFYIKIKKKVDKYLGFV